MNICGFVELVTVMKNIDVGSKVYALPGGIVTCNTYIVDIVNTIKPLLRELIDHANKVCYVCQ